MNINLIRRNLWKKLQSKKYRHSFVASQVGASVAAQIASTRMARGWTQNELARHANMSQVRISVLEDPGYENFSIKTLKRLAEALEIALIVRFAPFSEMLEWLSKLEPKNLAVPKFEDDSVPLTAERVATPSIAIRQSIIHGQSEMKEAASAAYGNRLRQASALGGAFYQHSSPLTMRSMQGGVNEINFN